MGRTITRRKPSRSASTTSHPGTRTARRPDFELPEGRYHDDRLERTWRGLSERDRSLLGWRVDGETLAQVGVRLGVTRERVRQLQVKAESDLLEGSGTGPSSPRNKVAALVGQCAAVPDQLLQQTLRTEATVALAAFMVALGFVRPRTWAGELIGWWSDAVGALDCPMRELAAQAPFDATELDERAEAAGLPADLPLHGLFSCAQSPVTLSPVGGWIRRFAQGRDSAFLWLRAQGEPRTCDEIAEAIGWPSLRGLRESLRRDERFTQLRPEGSWALSCWATTRGRVQYSSAVDAVVGVLRELGPLTRNQLAAETMARHPVSSRWVRQSLLNGQVGRTENGMYDLVERGAAAIEERAPARPTNMVESPDGLEMTIRLRVDADLLRGSGIPVSRWLTWRLGLHDVPSHRHFAINWHGGDLVLRRGTGTSAVSSLRAVAQSLGLVSGCDLVVLIRPEQATAEIRHGCTGTQCPAGLLR